MATPSSNGGNGRRPDGRFVTGNSGGPGNPYALHTARLRALLLDAVTDDDFTVVVAKLVEMAKGGNLAAIRDLLDRMTGRPKSTVELQQTEFDRAEIEQELEDLLQELVDERLAQADGQGKGEHCGR